LKDTKGYCYESEKTVKAKAVGPYTTDNMEDDTLAIESPIPISVDLTVK
jgi:hypothetical protein